MISIYSSKDNRSKINFMDSINESIQFDLVFGPKSQNTNRPYQKSDFSRGRLVKLIFIDKLYNDVLNLLYKERLSVDMK